MFYKVMKHGMLIIPYYCFFYYMYYVYAMYIFADILLLREFSEINGIKE